jgi:hypothetical protein
MERVRFAGGGGVFIDQETLKLTRCGCVPQVSLGRIGIQKERQIFDKDTKIIYVRMALCVEFSPAVKEVPGSIPD